MQTKIFIKCELHFDTLRLACHHRRWRHCALRSFRRTRSRTFVIPLSILRLYALKSKRIQNDTSDGDYMQHLACLCRYYTLINYLFIVCTSCVRVWERVRVCPVYMLTVIILVPCFPFRSTHAHKSRQSMPLHIICI